MTPSSARLRVFLFFSRLTVRFWASVGTGGRTRAQTAAHCDADDACVSRAPAWSSGSRVRGGVGVPAGLNCAPLDARRGRAAAAEASLQRSSLETWFRARIYPESGSGRQRRGEEGREGEGRGRGTPPVSPHLDCRDEDLNREIPAQKSPSRCLR